MINIVAKDQCCGCNVCVSACPVNAIMLSEDENGFLYPVIDKDKCIYCGKCETVCQYNIPEKNRKEIHDVYAATAKERTYYENSTSAGVFPFAARYVLEHNGVVFGAVLEKDTDRKFVCHHIRIDDLSELCKLQGSKYVQSNIENTFKECKEKLDESIMVLFSGTPCQIAGLYLYLGKEYPNLYTIDIVCHGVPNQKMFNDFVNSLEDKAEITFFRFRSKKDSGHNIMYQINNMGKKKMKSGYCYCYCYYAMFLSGKNYRESCFECRYAKQADKRMGDLSLCDYWGLQRVHPDIKHIASFKKATHYSGIMVNSEKGQTLLDYISLSMELYKSSFEKLRMFNEQLNNSTEKPTDYETLMSKYNAYGYKKLEADYRRKIGLKYYLYKLFFIMPKFIKIAVRNFQWKYLIREKKK